MPIVGGVYTAWAGTGVAGILLRGVAAAICLLPPTLLMGATLPAIARWVETSPDGVAWLGYFYGGNTAGAVIGSLLAGFYLLRVLRHRDRHLRRRGDQHGRRGRWRWSLRATRAVAASASSRRRRAGPARARSMGRLRGDRALGPDRAGERGDLDADRCRCCSARRRTRSR